MPTCDIIDFIAYIIHDTSVDSTGHDSRCYDCISSALFVPEMENYECLGLLRVTPSLHVLFSHFDQFYSTFAFIFT